MSDDSDYEEEEFLIYADFKNQLVPGEINANTGIKIIGIETNNPIAEINGNIFKGTFDFAMGTNVFFEKDPDAVPTDPLFEPSCKQPYKYLGKAQKVINFQRIFVENKPKETTGVEEMETEVAAEKKPSEDEMSLKVELNYEKAIKQFPAPAAES